MITKGLFTSDKDYWETPQSLFDELDAEFHFNLDPCCTHENAKCKDHYTIEEDGLKQKWGAKSFLQSPVWQGNRQMGGEVLSGSPYRS